MRNLILIVSFVLSILLLLSGQAFSQEAIERPRTNREIYEAYGVGAVALRGLEKRMRVRICITPEEELKQDGLHKARLQTDVELKLRRAGWRVVTDEELHTVPGMPHLIARIFAVKHGRMDLWAIYINLSLHQGVSMLRDSSVRGPYPTWRGDKAITLIGTDIMPGKIRDYVKDCVDDFLNMYLAVNPKE